jgi:hypothetical protein
MAAFNPDAGTLSRPRAGDLASAIGHDRSRPEADDDADRQLNRLVPRAVPLDAWSNSQPTGSQVAGLWLSGNAMTAVGSAQIRPCGSGRSFARVQRTGRSASAAVGDGRLLPRQRSSDAGTTRAECWKSAQSGMTCLWESSEHSPGAGCSSRGNSGVSSPGSSSVPQIVFLGKRAVLSFRRLRDVRIAHIGEGRC